MKRKKRGFYRMLSVALTGCMVFTTVPMQERSVSASEGWGALVAGTYQGTGEGYGGTLTASVTVDANHKVTAVEVISHKETAGYYERGSQVIASIIEQQSTNVDGVSGATFTSDAIKAAVENAVQEAAAGFAGGSGTAEDPYIIASESGLHYLQETVAAGTTYEGQYIRLSSDVTLEGEWSPIGSKEQPFAGTFDGANHTITGLVITESTQNAGLFGFADAGTCIKNVQLKEVDIQVTGTTGTAYAGALVANMKNDSTGAKISVIDHCEASGKIVLDAGENAAMAGGLVGMSNQFAAITNNETSVEVSVQTGAKTGNAGGLVGYMGIKALLMNNLVSSSVYLESTNANANAGGIAGTVNGILYNNVSLGTAEGTQGSVRTGSIAGNSASGSFSANCYYTGENSFGTESGKQDAQTVVKQSAEELNTQETALLMHENLTTDALNVMKTKVAEAAISGCEDFAALMERVEKRFYDWEYIEEQLSLSEDIWYATQYDASIFAGGMGTKEDPYTITTEEELRNFAQSLTKALDYEGVYIELEEDIDVSSTEWVQIGLGEYAFQGEFDGKDHSITGIQIGTRKAPYKDEGDTYYGFFGVLGEEAFIHNLSIETGIYVQSDRSVYVGGLAGYIEKSKIDQVTVDGDIWGKSGMVKTAANHFSGGLGGMAYRGVITNCVSNADVYGEAFGGIGEAGGILGLNNRTLTANCLSTGKISGTANRELEGMAAVGGIAGVHAGTMTNCLAIGETLSETYSQYVGALAGWTTGIGTLYKNYYSADALQTIEGKQVNPVVSVGWLVGTGVNDEGEAYSGGVEYESIARSGSALEKEALAATMNESFAAFPVNIEEYNAVTLLQWKACEEGVLPDGETAQITYVKPDIQEPEETQTLYNGSFYGRSDDKQLIVQIKVTDSVITEVLAVKNTSGGDVSQLLEEVLAHNGTSALTGTDALTVAVKTAVDTAIARMEKNDTTSYGAVDPSIFQGGNGTKEAPYQIANEKQLRAFAAALNKDETFEGIYLQLTNDIVLNGQWSPAGTDSHYPFKGTLDGGGHSISGLKIGTKEAPANIQFAGLFAYIEGGTVKNLTLKSPFIHVEKTDSSRVYAGALAAFADQNGTEGYFDCCQVTDGEITVLSASGAAYAGGFLGSAQYGTITNGMIDAKVEAKSTGSWCYAGVMTAVFARMGIINNGVTGTVTVDAPLNKAAIGGLAGFHSGASYNNVADVALVSVGTTGDVGALAGRNTGIGLMLDGYFNKERIQKEGANSNEAAGVGTLVSGDRDGMGEATNLQGLSQEELSKTAVITALNDNNETQNASLKRVLTLLADSWNNANASTLTLYDWAQVDGRPTIVYSLQNQEEETPKDETEIILTQEELVTGSPEQTTVDTALQGTQSESTQEETVVNTVKVAKVKGVSVKRISSKKAVLKWKKVSGANGYEIYRATKKNGKYTMIKQVKSGSKVKYTNTKLKKAKVYYYKIRAYKIVDGKKVYGAYSAGKKLKK